MGVMSGHILRSTHLYGRGLLLRISSATVVRASNRRDACRSSEPKVRHAFQAYRLYVDYAVNNGFAGMFVSSNLVCPLLYGESRISCR